MFEIIHERTRQYRVLKARNIHEAAAPLSQVRIPNDSVHRTLDIPELLDRILGFAGPQMLLVAWDVSAVWRSSSRAALDSRRPSTFRCDREKPKEYGELLPRDAEPQGEIDASVLEDFHTEVYHKIGILVASPGQKSIFPSSSYST